MAAGYTTSLLLNAQVILDERMEKPEFRHEPYYLIQLMRERGMNLFSKTTLDQLKTSDSRTVETFVMAKRAADVATARAHNHTLNAFGDSQKVTLSFTIGAYKYGVSLKMGGRNIYDRASMLATDLRSQAIAGNNVIEAAAAAYLEANMTQTNGASTSYDGGTLGDWNSTDYVWEIPAVSEDYIFQYIQEIMAINDYDTALDIVCDNVGWTVGEQKRAQGSGNQTNLGWQMDNLNIVKSRRVVDSNYKATFYVMPAGTVGMVDRIPKENKEGHDLKNYTYSNMSDPLGTGMQLATHYYETGADNSSTGAETQDVTFEYENSNDYSFVKAPLSSGANDTPIFKFGLKS